MRKKHYSFLRKFFALSILIFTIQIQVRAQNYDMKLGYRRPISAQWFGINSSNMIREDVYVSQPDILAHVPDFHPKVIRFPGGGIANWWDWKKGWFVDDPEVAILHPNLGPPLPDKLEDLKKLLDATGAVPLLDLNMISSNLQYQLSELKYADSIGIPVKYVELGNEFYLAGGDDSTIIYSIFPTPQSYGTVASRWIDSIHYYFPNAKVAAQGAFNRNNEPRRIAWDDSVVLTLEGEDAITFHHYYSASASETQGVGDGLYSNDDIPEFMYRPFKAWNVLAKQDIPKVRPGREVWITEYNLQDTHIPVHGSWGHGLFVATQTLLYLESPRITQVSFFTMDGAAGYGGLFDNTTGFVYSDDAIFISPPDPPATTPWSHTAAGKTANLVSDAIEGMTYASPLSFSSIPMMSAMDIDVPVTYPSVYGWQFSDDNSSSAIIVNLSGTDYKISTGSVFPGGGTYDRYYDDPLSYIGDEKELTEKSSNLPATLTLKAYSVTKINSSAVPAPPPTVSIFPLGPTTFCLGDSVQLDAGSGYYKYQWSTGSADRKIWAKADGNYVIKVWNSEDGYYAADTMHVTVNPLPAAPTIINSGKDVFCQGSNVTLSPKNPVGSLTYLWSTGVAGNSINVSTGGTYYVSAIDNHGCAAISAGRTITVNPLPVPTVTPSGTIDICDGATITLACPGAYKSYQWSDNKWGPSRSAKVSGLYTVTVTDANSCKGTSAPVTVIVHSPPLPSVSVNGPTAFCKGTSPTFLSTINGYTYQWKKGSKELSGATDSKYYPTESANYTVMIEDTYDCTKKSAGTNITVLALPTAQISVAGTKNICNGDTRTMSATAKSGYSYQWQKNNVNISGAVQSTYTVSLAANYTCKVTDANGCSKISNIITITNNCKTTEDVADGSVTTNPDMIIYPNPASDIIHIHVDFTGNQSSNTYLEIRNLLGEVIYTETKSGNGDTFTTDVFLDSKFANGVYVATVHCGDQFVMKKFIVSGQNH